MRITGGEHRGVPLFTPENDAIRPTSDKARQAIFNSLMSGRFDIDLDGATILDGTAGTGAMGLEALSRGAGFVHFADSDAKARALVKKNADKLRVASNAYRIHASAAQSLPQADKVMDVIFLDPPYGQDFLPVMVQHLCDKDWANEHTLFVLEEARKTGLSLQLDILDIKEYGAAQVVYARRP